MTVEFELARAPGSRVIAMQVGGAPLDESKSIGLPCSILSRAAATTTRCSATPRRITPDNDAPLMVNEVVEYLRKLGTVRTGVEGRIVGS